MRKAKDLVEFNYTDGEIINCLRKNDFVTLEPICINCMFNVIDLVSGHFEHPEFIIHTIGDEMYKLEVWK